MQLKIKLTKHNKKLITIKIELLKLKKAIQDATAKKDQLAEQVKNADQ